MHLTRRGRYLRPNRAGVVGLGHRCRLNQALVPERLPNTGHQAGRVPAAQWRSADSDGPFPFLGSCNLACLSLLPAATRASWLPSCHDSWGSDKKRHRRWASQICNNGNPIPVASANVEGLAPACRTSSGPSKRCDKPGWDSAEGEEGPILR